MATEGTETEAEERQGRSHESHLETLQALALFPDELILFYEEIN